MSTRSAQFFTPAAPPPPPPQAQPGYARRAWDGTKWAVGGALHGVTRPIAWAFNPIGDGIGSGLVSGAKKEIEQMVQPKGPLVTQLQESVEQALLKQPPKELLRLKDLIKKALATPDALTTDDVRLTNAFLKMLMGEEAKLLKHLATDITPEGIQLCRTIARLFEDIAENEHLDYVPEHLEAFGQEIGGESNEKLQDFDAILNTVLERNQGALIQAMSFLRHALLSDEQGLLSEAVEILKKKCTDKNSGLMKQVVDQLTHLLDKHGGPLDLLTTRLTVGDESIIGKAIALLKTKLLEKEGIVDEIDKRFNHEEEGIIVKALGIAKKKIDETFQEGLLLLKKELTSETGLMATLRQQLSEGDDSVLGQAIDLLDESLFHPERGMVSKFRKELTDENKGVLSEALKIIAKKLNDEKEGILAQGLALLKLKLNAEDDGVLPEAMRLLDHKLNGPNGVVEKLQHQLLNEHDGALIKATDLLQAKLNDEKTGIFAKAVNLLEKRLLADNGLIDSLEKKLTADETGLMARAVESMKKALEKRDGPLDLLDQRVQKLLTDSLEVLKNKCLDEREGLIAQTLERLNAKLNAENGVLDTFSKRLNDPKDGMIAKAIETFKTKLLDENGPLALLEKKLLDENEGILAKAIDLLNRKLQQSGGPLDALQKKLIDKDGILDQMLNTLEDRLTHKERGILTKAKQYLSNALMDEKEGVLVQALDLLNRKLNEKGGVLDLLDIRLTGKDTGILSRAAGILQDKLTAMFDQIDERFTGQAHPLLSSSRKKLMELRKAIVAKNKRSIQNLSKQLEQLLEQMAIQQRIVFTKQPISLTDHILLDQLKRQLPGFYSDTPPDQGTMLIGVEAGLSAMNRYYGSYEGIAARIGAIVQETITDGLTDSLDPLLTKVANLPKQMINHVLGKTSPDSMEEEDLSSDGGTVSQFLANGGSILKNILGQGSQAISKQALSSFASVLALGLKQVIGKMEEGAAFRQPRMTLKGIVGALSHVQEQGNWSELYQNLIDASEALKSVKIYVNGFRLSSPSSGGEQARNAEGVYSDNINALQEATNPAVKDPQSQNWQERATAEKDKLVDNTTNFLTMKHIYEGICKLRPTGEQFYLDLLKQAKAKDPNAIADPELLKKLFFEKLEESKINFFIRLYAKAQYYFYGSIVKRYTTKASTVYFEQIFNYINERKTENFNSLRNQVTKNFTRYLTILGGAYQNVAENPGPMGTMNEMLKAELEKKESNLGFETQELYLEFAHKVLHKTTGSGFTAWLAKKFIGKPEELVRSIIDKSLGSLQDSRGYTHALNSVIREQLEEIWKLLQNVDQGEQSHPAADINELPEARKNELSGLVKNLFEVLRKSKCQTKDELRDLIKGKLLSAKVNQAIDDLFIEEVIEKVTNLLAISVQSLLQEDQLLKLTYKFAGLINRTFEVGNEATLQQMQEEERKITKLGGQILRLAVNTAVEEKFDFSGKKQQKETNRFITDLHQHSTEFFTKTGQDLEALTHLDFGTVEGRNKIDSIIEGTLAYESECYESNFQAKGSKVNSDNKDEIGERYLGIAEQSQPIVQTISRLKQYSKILENIQTVAPHLSQINTIMAAIPLRLFHPGGPTDEDLTFCENQVAILDSHLEEIEKMRHIDFDRATQIHSFCTAQSGSDSHLLQIANEKKQSLGGGAENAALRGRFTALEQEIVNAFDDTALRPLLLSKLRTMREATTPEQVDTARLELLELCRRAMFQANISILIEKIKAETRVFATILIGLQKAVKMNSFCMAQSELDSPLDKIINEKKRTIGSILMDASLRSQFTAFEQEILHSFHHGDLLSQLLSKVKTIEEATFSEQIDTAHQEFLALCRQAMSRATTSIETERSNYYQAFQRARTAIDETHLLEPNQEETARRGIRESIALTQQHLQALATWEGDHIKQVPYINFSPVDMTGLQDWASGLVCDRVRERLDGFMSFLKQEETYRYGLLNHLLLVPYVKTMGI
jgi:hypothetical protein